MNEKTERTYDEVPYPSYPHPNTHPRHLEALAALFGLESPPLAGCRVLELGCASGGNLIPLADEYPDARFVGIDLSSRQIEDGRATIADFELDNLQLRKADICEIDDSWGQFDYIISYGVFSWVPPQVQNKIFEICRRNLVPNGVAAVSYNTYPGWHLRAAIRDLMRYHVGHLQDPRQKIAQALAVLDFMSSACDENETYGRLLKGELKLVGEVDKSYLYHEHLEDHNQPMYFHEFIESAERHGLQYLAESNVSRMLMANLPMKAQEMLSEAPLIRREQYLDFLRNVGFRTTLLCHREIELDRDLHDGRLGRFRVQLSCRPEPKEVDLHGDAPVTFNVKEGGITVSLPLSKAAIVGLGRTWPEAVDVADLYGRALEMLGPSAVDGDSLFSVDALYDMLATALAANILEIYVHAPRCVSAISDRPLASRLARFQAARGMLIANCWQRGVELNDLGRFILQRLDGQHDRVALETELREALQSGRIVNDLEGQHPMPSDEQVAEMVDWVLATCSSAALLVA
jgi:methyltransferase-like protein/2-polyprenyl-3-methyl-5-hydroxy-6-metoxy-1,4-benzoquinol methylase